MSREYSSLQWGFVRLEYVMVQFEAFSSADSLIDNSTGMDETILHRLCTSKSLEELLCTYRRTIAGPLQPDGEGLAALDAGCGLAG